MTKSDTETLSLGSEGGGDADATPLVEDARTEREHVFASGARLGRYVVVGLLGSGGMGEVYRARDPKLDRDVAIKVLRAELAPGARAQARLEREAQAMARLAHPNVAAIYDVGAVGAHVYLAMELVEGGTLRAKHAARPPWREIVDDYVQAARGLAAAHAAGLVHRDFKPENVLVGTDRRVRVVDFGLVRVESDATDAAVPAAAHGFETSRSTLVGTPAYMAPEATSGSRVDARADQYSFCVALHQALYGELPVRGRAVRVPATPRVPRSIARALERGLAARPDDRHASMEALASVLARSTTPRRRALAIVGVASVVAAVGATTAYAIGSRPAAIATPPTELRVGPDAPYSSITSAIAAARHLPSVTTIRVAAGTYDASRETFPIELRDGLSLVGDDARTTSIVGVARYDHTAAGGTAVEAPIWVGVLVGDPRATQTIRGIAFDPGRVDVPAWGIYCDRGNAFSPSSDAPAPATPNLVIDRIAIARFDHAIVIGTSDRPAPSGCNATITRSRIASRAVGVFVVGAGYGSNAPNRVAARIGGDRAEDGNEFAGNRDPDRTGSDDQHRGTAILAYDRATPLAIRHDTFTDGDFGVVLNAHGAGTDAAVDDNTFTGLTSVALGIGANFELRSLQRNFFASTIAPEGGAPTCEHVLTLGTAVCVAGYGDRAPGPQIRRARDNVFAGNDVGIYVTGTPLAAGRAFDFGTASDPGHNTFVCNSRARAHPGHDLWIDADAATPLAFAGNAWDHAPPTRGELDAADGTDVVARPAIALDTTGATFHERACPLPHDP